MSCSLAELQRCRRNEYKLNKKEIFGEINRFDNCYPRDDTSEFQFISGTFLFLVDIVPLYLLPAVHGFIFIVIVFHFSFVAPVLVQRYISFHKSIYRFTYQGFVDVYLSAFGCVYISTKLLCLENAFLHTYLTSFMSTTVRSPHHLQTKSVTSDIFHSKLWMYQSSATAWLFNQLSTNSLNISTYRVSGFNSNTLNIYL